MYGRPASRAKNSRGASSPRKASSPCPAKALAPVVPATSAWHSRSMKSRSPKPANASRGWRTISTAPHPEVPAPSAGLEGSRNLITKLRRLAGEPFPEAFGEAAEDGEFECILAGAREMHADMGHPGE